jgi:hypothetical protein
LFFGFVPKFGRRAEGGRRRGRRGRVEGRMGEGGEKGGMGKQGRREGREDFSSTNPKSGFRLVHTVRIFHFRLEFHFPKFSRLVPENRDCGISEYIRFEIPKV